MFRNYIRGIGMLVGMIFGAGVFALPFSYVQAGFFWGNFHFLLALALIIFLHLWYGEVAYNVSGKHRFTGYAEILFGRKAKWLAFLISLLTSYGALLVYGILGGIFLANLFFLSPDFLSLAVFAVGGFLIFLNFKKIADINFYLTVFLLGLVAVIFLIAFPKMKMVNFIPGGSEFLFTGNWFLPYGIWLFALAGFAVVPEVTEIFSGKSLKVFKRTILASIFLCAFFYMLFIFTVVGTSGKMASEDALSGLVGILGRSVVILGSLLGFLAVFTSFIALGADLKNIFYYDFRLPKWISWICVAVPPVLLFFTGAKNFIGILGITGSIGLGLTGIFIILMVRKIRRQKGENGKFSFLSFLAIGLLVAGIITAAISEIL